MLNIKNYRKQPTCFQQFLVRVRIRFSVLRTTEKLPKMLW